MRRVGLFALLAVLLCAGCPKKSGAPGPPGPELAPPEEGRFPHRRHRDVACTACHDPADVLAGRPARPGARDHAPCDESGCHREAFLGAPGDLCELCHEQVVPTRPGQTTLSPYPPARGLRAQAAEFSHALHLDFDRMEDRVGFHVSCTDCHPVTESGLGRPEHAACARCHAPESTPRGAPSMRRCRQCHQERSRPPARRRRMIVGDLHFSHRNHRFDRRGKLIRCATCHTETSASALTGGQAPPATAACVDCHDDRERTPADKRMSQCQTCHFRKSAGLRAIPPRSHLPVGERPADHTQAFRRDHGAEAEREPERCARCHTFMSGTSRDTCDECHQTMRPRDHVVTWREYDHGPEAATRSDRCRVCHAADFCVGCHSQRPRSHLPADFARGGHALRARLNSRACLTCHVPERDCIECHATRRRR